VKVRKVAMGGSSVGKQLLAVWREGGWILSGGMIQGKQGRKAWSARLAFGYHPAPVESPKYEVYMAILAMADLDLAGKRVLIREDLNVPVKNGKIVNDARIRAALPSIQLALQKGATVMLMSHLGRPKEGVPMEQQPDSKLAPVAAHLSQLLGSEIKVMPQDFSAADSKALKAGSCVMLENVRCNPGENDNADAISQYYASLCDVFVMDAFGTAHRAQGSTHGVAKFAAVACAGPLLKAELDALERALSKPVRPLLAVVGGAKVSSKLQVLESLAKKVDALVVGGGIANTFLPPANRSASHWSSTTWSNRPNASWRKPTFHCRLMW